MKTTKLLYLIPTALGLALVGAFAQTASSPAIGFNKVTCKGNSDTLLAVPFHQTPAFTGAITGTSGASNEVLTASSTWTADEFLGSHYVRITSGAKAGYYYEIASNDANTVTLNPNGDDISGIAAADTFKVVPHWTLGSLFPGGQGVHASAFDFLLQSEIIIPEDEMKINKGASKTYFYLSTPGEWREFGGGATSRDGVIVYPHQAFIVRHNNAGDTKPCFDGRVPSDVHAIQIDIGAGANDVYFSIDRPIPVSLDDSGLISSGAFTPSQFSFLLQDELLVLEEDSKNPGTAETYYYLASANEWRQFGDVSEANVGSNEVFKPGQAVIIRKKGGTPSTTFSINTPTYPN